MPVLSQPNSDASVLVSVPLPQQVQDKPKQQAQPQQAAPQQPQQDSDESLFTPIKSPKLLLLPHRASQDKPVRASFAGSMRELLRLAKYKAPAGGMVVRGQFFEGGKMLPKEATQAHPAPSRLAAGQADPLAGKTIFITGLSQQQSPNRFTKAGDDAFAGQPAYHIGASSPSVREAASSAGAMTFPEARREMGGGAQKAHAELIKEALRKAKVPEDSFSLLHSTGDWAPQGESPGSENSIVHIVHAPLTPEQTKLIAAHIGYHSNQRSVLTFRPHESGPHALFRMFLPNVTAEKTRSLLDTHGVPFRTIIPSKERDGHHVVVVDFGYDPDLPGKLKTIEKEYRTGLHGTKGTAEFVGDSPSRTNARGIYQKIHRALGEGAMRPRF